MFSIFSLTICNTSFQELLKSVENYFDKDGSKIVDMPVKVKKI